MIVFFKTNLLWTEGISLCGLFLMLGIVGFLWFRPLLYMAIGLCIFSLYFFRNPERVCVQALYDNTVIVCPADGKIVDIQYDYHASFEGYEQKISIFLSPFDVHVNWIPISGIIEKIWYHPGEHAIAFLPKASQLNEHNDVLIKGPYGAVLVRQIAGIIARRICCWVQEGDKVHFGDKYGMIRFGSRVDLFIPSSVILYVGVGQRVYGGKTVLGRWIC